MSPVRRVALLSLSLASFACGGAARNAPPPATPEPVAVPTPTSTPPTVAVPEPAPTVDATPVAPAASAAPPPDDGTTMMRRKAHPTTPHFTLANDGDRDLLFASSKGWQPVIFAYSGTPPSAKSAQLFPTYCTASCDADVVCPVCTEPKTKKEELLGAEKSIVAPASSFDVPWDGQIYLYEKAAGKKCKCWRKEPLAAGEYTVKACGLRAAKEAGHSSKATCVESKVAMPPAGDGEIRLSFPK